MRCREVGHAYLKEKLRPNTDHVELNKTVHEGSGGTEVFLSFEDVTQGLLIGYLRLRIPGEWAHRPEIAGQNAAIVRALHGLEQTVPVGNRIEVAFQHKGYGSSLLSEAERVAVEEYDRKKMLVISA